MLPNNGISFSGVLIPTLLNNPFASCSLMNLDFLLLQLAHFDDQANLPFLASIILQSIFFYSLCILNNLSAC